MSAATTNAESSAIASTQLRPYAHQITALYCAMLPQPLVFGRDSAEPSRSAGPGRGFLIAPMLLDVGAGLASGAVTFLFTDVAGSTALWEEAASSMSLAMARHDDLVELAVAETAGAVVRPRGEGDSRFAVFPGARSALDAATRIQAAMLREPWTTPRPIRLRIAMHTGDSELREGDYYGTTVNRCARLRGIAHPGQTLASGATAQLVSQELPAGVSLRDLGMHRLRDVAEPERVYQVLHTNLPADFPPLTSIKTTNLPHPADRFLGRQTHIEAIRGFVSRGHRLVTLTGPGGTGKTRLAIEAAAAMGDDFPAGTFWVGLSALRQASMVLPSVADALEVHADDLANRLGSGRTLLVLDNMEQILDATDHVVALLERCPNLAVLVTSREALGAFAELRYPVPPLTEQEAVSLFCELARCESSADIAELCRRLDHLPLAIELAAARAKSLSARQMLERLGTRLDLLRADRAAEPRQRTLEAAIEWSYELLSRAERSLFRRLSVFAAGCTLEVAEDVLLADIDVLDALVAKSLVTYADERYSMLATVRQYARRRLSEGPELADCEAAFAEWALSLAELENARLRGFDQLDALARLDAERDNLHAAFAILLDNADPDRPRRFARAADWWMERRGQGRELMTWLQATLARPGGTAAARGWALMSLARVLDLYGDSRAAVAASDQAMNLALEIGDDALVACVHERRAVHADPPAARRLFEQALDIFRRLDLTDDCARVMINLGSTELNAGDYALAAVTGQEAVQLVRRQGNRHGIGVALSNLATALIALDRDREAQSLAEQAVDAFDAVGDELGQVLSLQVAAALEAKGGRLRHAALLSGAADVGWARLGVVLEPSEQFLQDTVETVLRDADPREADEWRAFGAGRTAAELANSWRAGLL